MTTSPYLAMTAAEFCSAADLPERIAWMACHFSPYCAGLSNLPASLPRESLLILNDITPIHGHDPDIITRQLEACLADQGCSGLLLDFQRFPCDETAALADALIQALPCPVAVSEPFARELTCPVFLPPCPPHEPLKDYITPWQGREIWLELALDGEVISLTQEGADFSPLSGKAALENAFSDTSLHSHYRIELSSQQARFTLFRTPEDLEALCREGAELGVSRFIGLYQELSAFRHKQ